MTAKEDARKDRKAADRKARLAEELRANLRRRKKQKKGKKRIANSE
jgi:hypothetical protein